MPRVLIVDDHAVVRKGIAAILASKEGWQIVGEATNGNETIALVKALKPDIAILDYSIPPTNGAELLRECLLVHPTMQALLFTMHSEDTVVLNALQAGARGVLFKGEQSDLLNEALETIARGEPFLRGRVGELALNAWLHGATSDKAALTTRETEVLCHLAKGFSGKETAQLLGISPKTVEIHRSSVMRKLNLRNLVELVHYAIRVHLIDP
ncbi:response regulator transcription factor [Nitratireductor sp. OM-1]|uniref:response regulator n=1 Tax=Nitratireductor sp. OM-1 TaxID=1756988 RepID=UPI000DDEA20C|nr:response regulator transcription factor [Nitratireductor sp. OM-1]